MKSHEIWCFGVPLELTLSFTTTTKYSITKKFWDLQHVLLEIFRGFSFIFEYFFFKCKRVQDEHFSEGHLFYYYFRQPCLTEEF